MVTIILEHCMVTVILEYCMVTIIVASARWTPSKKARSVHRIGMCSEKSRLPLQSGVVASPRDWHYSCRLFPIHEL